MESIQKTMLVSKHTIQEDKTIEVKVFELYIHRERGDWSQKKAAM
jgi:hypothetical protein